MGHKTFIGGVHPYDGKELSKDSPIKEVLPKGDMVYPVSQHIGAPAKPVVAVGDTVLKGQMIAEAGGFVSSPIYSSTPQWAIMPSGSPSSSIYLSVASCRQL